MPRRVPGRGDEALGFDFAAAMERMRRLRADLSQHDSALRFRDQLGVEVYIGQGRFAGPDCIEVDGQQLRFDRAILDGESEGFARVHLRQGTDKILGATLVAAHAGEMISELSRAITNGLGLAAIGRTIHPYPTQAEAIKKLADAYNRTRLTGGVKKILGLWLRWRRR